MVRRRNIQIKKRSSSSSSSKKNSRRTKRIKKSIKKPIIKQTSTEYLDDETKLAKRHLTKEMWQLVSIAVKRMADELVSISNNQRTGNQEQQTTLVDTNNILGQSISTIQQSNTGAGDELFLKEKLATVNESVKRRTSPLQMLEPSLNTKKKGVSNNATRRLVKSKIQNNKSSKKKITRHVRLNPKSK